MTLLHWVTRLDTARWVVLPSVAADRPTSPPPASASRDSSGRSAPTSAPLTNGSRPLAAPYPSALNPTPIANDFNDDPTECPSYRSAPSFTAASATPAA